MTTKQIEECYELEKKEEEEYTKFISLSLYNTSVFVVDPYMININDLLNRDPGQAILVRAKRPAWGIGDLHRFIFKLDGD